MRAHPHKLAVAAWFSLAAGGYSLEIPASAATAPASEARAQIGYTDFLARVETHSPDASVENKLSERAQEVCLRKGYLPDPVFVGGVDGNTPKVSVSQEIPWPGTLAVQAKVACAETQLTKTDLAEAALLRTNSAARLFLTAVAKQEGLTIGKKALQEIARLQDYVKAKSKSGIATHSERLQVELERVQLSLTVSAQEKELGALKKQLRLVAGFSPTSDTEFVLQWPQQPRQATLASPDLLAQRLTLENEVAVQQLNLERLSSRPSLNTQITAMRDSMGQWMPGVMLGFRIPLFSAFTAQSLDTHERLNAQVNTQNSGWYLQKKNLALDVATERTQQAQENLKTLNEHAIPLAEEHLSLVFSDFSASRATTQEVVQTQRDLLRLQTEKNRATFDLWMEELNAGLLKLGVADTNPLNFRDFPTIALPAMGGSMNGQVSAQSNAWGTAPRTTKPSKARGPTNSAPEVTTPSAPSGGMNM